MGNRTNLYVICVILFPLGFAAFVVGFGCPVWQASSNVNFGLWQSCKTVFIDCSTLNFDSGGDWMIGVRAVEIFALVMYVAAAIDILYENTCTNFRGRPLSERIATGIICILAGLGGLAGIIVYAVKTEDKVGGYSYGWALALVAASSALAVILGVGFCVSGFFFEKKKKHDHPKGQINGRTPHLTSNDQNYELSAYASRNAYGDDRSALTPAAAANDNLPGFAIYNGMLNQPGQRNSLPLGVTASSAALSPPSYNVSGRALPPIQQKTSQYYSLSDDRLLDPTFDLSEGFTSLPARSRTTGRPVGRESQYTRGGGAPLSDDPYYRGGGRARGEDPYYSRGGGRAEDPYSRGGPREDDPYNRVHRAPRAGYNDPYGFDRIPDARGPGSTVDTYDRANYGRSSNIQPSRDSYYRPGRF